MLIFYQKYNKKLLSFSIIKNIAFLKPNLFKVITGIIKIKPKNHVFSLIHCYTYINLLNICTMSACIFYLIIYAKANASCPLRILFAYICKYAKANASCPL